MDEALKLKFEISSRRRCAPHRAKLGALLARIGERAGLTDDDMTLFSRDKTPAEPLSFE